MGVSSRLASLESDKGLSTCLRASSCKSSFTQERDTRRAQTLLKISRTVLASTRWPRAQPLATGVSDK